MAGIQILDQNTINKIAAGEVIERPAAVVKELLENAIDAKATAVTIEIKEGGISFIRITDNGSGISRDEIPLAFLRHSTSKIRSVEDLITVSSLGFRGEALSSIASVAQVELITKTPDALNGVRYLIEGSEEKKIEEIGSPEGTTFIVRNLFYNTPARRKFLKTAQTEAGYIADVIEKIALSHPDISIRFINNNQNKLHSSGNNNVKDIIYHIYGRDITSNLLCLSQNTGDISISGYIGKPVIARGNRSFENYFINGRYIKSNVISKAIEDAYQTFLMQHKYPFTVLYLTVNPELLDVNVHPTKMELRFRNAEEIYQVIYDVLKETLAQKELIPEVALVKKESDAATPEKKTVRPPEPFEIRRQEKEAAALTVRETGNYGTKELYNPKEKPLPKKMPSVKPVSLETDNRKEMVKEQVPSQEEGIAAAPVQLELFDDKLLSKAAKEKHRIIGQLFETYWLVEYQSRFFIIDQHAAHEKVLYEKITSSLKSREYTSQLLNPPTIITLTVQEEEIFKQYKGQFEEIGFEIEHFGGKEYCINAVPDNLFGIAREGIFIEMLDSLSNEIKTVNKELVLQKIASMSCKAAVKGNHAMSFAEASHLIEQLLELENPYNCPHGRPTIIAMSKQEIEKKFKRIV